LFSIWSALTVLTPLQYPISKQQQTNVAVSKQ
jgi:hypothetical protein